MQRKIYHIRCEKIDQIKSDLNSIIISLRDEDFGIYPVVINLWIKDGYDSYTEIHSEFLYIVKWADIVSFYSPIYGIRLLMDDRYNEQERIFKESYIFFKLFKDSIDLMGDICTPLGNMVTVSTFNDEDFMLNTEYMTFNYKNWLDDYILPIESLWISVFDYRDQILNNMKDDMTKRMINGEIDHASSVNNPYYY